MWNTTEYMYPRIRECILPNLYPCVSENFRGYMYSFLYPLRILILRDTNRAQLVFGIRRTKRIQKGYVYPNTFLGYARIRRIRIRAGRCSYPLILEYDEDTKIDTCILENIRIHHGYNQNTSRIQKDTICAKMTPFWSEIHPGPRV